MSTQTQTLIAPDGLKLHGRAWLPDGSPIALVLLVHGLAEHSGRYAHVGEFLAGQGYAVYAVDYRAHGRSEGAVRAICDHFGEPVSDVKTGYDWATSAFPSVSVFILAHSLGTLVALLFTLEYPNAVRGLVLSATMLAVAKTSRGQMLLLTLLDRCVPQLPFLKLDADAISRDPAERQKYDGDPLNFRGRLRVHMLREMIVEARTALEHLPEIKLPVLILHGGADALANKWGSEVAYERIGSPDKTLKIYPGLYHEILNEPERQQVMDDIAAWLSAHLK